MVCAWIVVRKRRGDDLVSKHNGAVRELSFHRRIARHGKSAENRCAVFGYDEVWSARACARVSEQRTRGERQKALSRPRLLQPASPHLDRRSPFSLVGRGYPALGGCHARSTVWVRRGSREPETSGPVRDASIAAFHPSTDCYTLRSEIPKAAYRNAGIRVHRAAGIRPL